jgi:hypothetical protein
LRCGTCGSRLIHHRPASDATKGTNGRYRCQRIACDDHVSISAPVVEGLVVKEALRRSKRLVARTPDPIDLAPLEEALQLAERRFNQIQEPESQDALGDAWAATAKARREERDAAAVVLGEARREAGASQDEWEVTLGQIWEDLDPEQQREGLSWHFESVTVHRVERGAKPKLSFVKSNAKRPYRPLEWYPPELVWMNPPPGTSG